MMLARKLLRLKGECAVRYDHRLGESVLSRRHFFNNSSATCVATLAGHVSFVSSVAFHPTASLLATGSADSTVKLWLLSSDKPRVLSLLFISRILFVSFHQAKDFRCETFANWSQRSPLHRLLFQNIPYFISRLFQSNQRVQQTAQASLHCLFASHTSHTARTAESRLDGIPESTVAFLQTNQQILFGNSRIAV